MTDIVVGPTRYRPCTVCGNAAPVREIRLPDSKPVDILRCHMCDVRKCDDCRKQSGQYAYIPDPTVKRCPRGHLL